jgi:hypothetical protein
MEMTSKELTIPELKVQFTPVEISFNFDEINERLDEYLSQKISLVTEETIKDEKKLVASLRKEGELIKTTFKDYKNKAIAPLTDVEKQIILIVDKFKQTADSKNEQVKRIEDETKKQCHDLLIDFLGVVWDLEKVSKEFRKADISGLVKLTSLTPKGGLTKQAQLAVESLVTADLQQQTTIQARLMSVEIKSLRADIQPPLSRANVEAFLYADDFDARLDSLIQAEVARKQEAEERMRKKLEAETQRQIDEALEKQRREIEARERDAAADMDKQRQAEASRLAAEQYAKAEAETMQADEVKARLSHLHELDARYPDPDNKAMISALHQQLDAIEPKRVEPHADAIDYKVTVTYKVTKEFVFRSRPNADNDRIKAHFRSKVIGAGIDAADILDVVVLQDIYT